jgi:hypothetical protein
MRGIDWRERAARLLVAAAMSLALAATSAGTASAEGEEPGERVEVAVAGEGAEGDVAIFAAPGVEVRRVAPIPTTDLRRSLEPSRVPEMGVREALYPTQEIPSYGVSNAFYSKRYRTIPLNRPFDPDRVPRTDLRRSLEPSRIRSHRLGRP